MNSEENFESMVLHVGTKELRSKEAEVIAAEFTEVVRI